MWRLWYLLYLLPESLALIIGRFFVAIMFIIPIVSISILIINLINKYIKD